MVSGLLPFQSTPRLMYSKLKPYWTGFLNLPKPMVAFL